MAMEIEAPLLFVRALAHLTTFLIVASFYDPKARYRLGVSLFAFCLGGSSFALFVQIVTNWAEVLEAGPQVWGTLFALSVMAPVAYARGNLAKLLPRMKWKSHP